MFSNSMITLSLIVMAAFSIGVLSAAICVCVGAWWVFRTKREAWEGVLPGKPQADVFNLDEEQQWSEEARENENRSAGPSGIPIPGIVGKQAERARQQMADRMAKVGIRVPNDIAPAAEGQSFTIEDTEDGQRGDRR